MINRQSIRVRKYAKREMLYNNSEHAIYGLSYVDRKGYIVEELAETPDKIKYFYSDNSYMNCVNSLHEEYSNTTEQLDIYALHRKDFQ